MPLTDVAEKISREVTPRKSTLEAVKTEETGMPETERQDAIHRLIMELLKNHAMQHKLMKLRRIE
jgi:hypothetical protein